MINRTASAFAPVTFALFAAAVMTAASVSTAAAESDAERIACTPDAQAHCADEIPDRDKVYACLVQKVNLLQPACKKIISDSIASKNKKK